MTATVQSTAVSSYVPRQITSTTTRPTLSNGGAGNPILLNRLTAGLSHDFQRLEFGWSVFSQFDLTLERAEG